MESPEKAVAWDLRVLEDLAHNAPAQVLASVNRHHGRPPIRMPKEHVTAAPALLLKTVFPQQSDYGRGADRR